MDSARWQHLTDIVGECLDAPSAERDALARTRCAGDEALYREVLAWLANGAGDDSFLQHSPPVDTRLLATNTPAADTTHWIGRRLGPYRIIEAIARGGMGRVFRAVRDDDEYQKAVAIKLIRADLVGESLAARFRMERQILAGLDHPNIARLIDGGTTEDGVPYLVMDYVDGEPISTYCAKHALGVRERLHLFCEVCAAVQFAHQRLVVHRDLKPSNILVDNNGTVKLLDFGIARLLDASGASEPTTIHAFTPEYASPEQVKGEVITTASDIYSLGVLLYRLLTERSPYRTDTSQPHALMREIISTDPPKPSVTAHTERPAASSQPTLDDARLRSALRGDLDHIVLKALRKEPTQRYPSVEQLAEDVRRHLDNRPVRAREGARAYRARKFFVRHRFGVAFGSMAVLSLLGLTFYALQQAHTARMENARAERHFASVRGLVSRFIGDVFLQIVDVPGTSKAQQSLLDTGTEYLDQLGDEAAGNRPLLLEIAIGHIKLAQFQERTLMPAAKRADTAKRALAAVAEAERLAPPDPPSRQRRLVAQTLLAASEADAQNFTAAKADFETAAMLARQTPDAGEPAELTDARAGALAEFGRSPGIDIPPTQRLRLLEEAYANYLVARASAKSEKARDDADNSRAATRLWMARTINEVFDDPQRQTKSLAYAKESVEIQEVLYQRSPKDLKNVANLALEASTTATIAAHQGDFALARDYFRKAREYDAQMSALDSDQPLTILNRIGMQLEQAEMELRAKTSPRVQLAALAETEQWAQRLPQYLAGQRQMIAVRAWLDALWAEFSLRRSDETDLATHERIALKHEAIARFENSNNLVAQVPELVDADQQDIVDLVHTGAARARASLARLQAR